MMKPIAVIGAGPYGLAVAARLRADGLDPHVFGQVMSFWQRHMPDGMLLRSSWEASHIGDPTGPGNLSSFEAWRGAQLARPIPRADFVAYGEWFKRTSFVEVDLRQVTSIDRGLDHFVLRLGSGDSVQARRVVVAAGIACFRMTPGPLRGFGGELVSHSADHAILSTFRGRTVIVIGGGQSAVESAALLCEAGADVELVLRADRIRWLRRSDRLHTLPTRVRALLYARADVGPMGLSVIVAHQRAFAHAPSALRDRLGRRAIRPAASAWLEDRIASVKVTCGTEVVHAEAKGARIKLDLGPGGDRVADHVICATGYRVDIARYPFLGRDLLRQIAMNGGSPVLDSTLQSTVPGLHFVGAPSAFSFGPVGRFVAGTSFAADAVLGAATRDVRRRSRDISYAPVVSAEK